MSSALHYADDTVTLMHGDALDCAEDLDTGSVQTIVTSPPYFGLRDYDEPGQIGQENTIAEYVAALVALFRELRRVLADDGTVWLNLGDSFARDPGKGFSGTPNGRNLAKMGYAGGSLAGLPAKNLIGVPWRVAFALQEDGWILRSDIIWSKVNPMPEPVTDRPTKAHEYLFLFAKSQDYYYNADAIREPHTSDRDRGSGPRSKAGTGSLDAGAPTTSQRHPLGRNKRSVWSVASDPFPEAHFATYPPELIRPCILAGSRQGDVVLDPFSGSGTTGMVANQEGRRYVGFDLNADYLDLSLRTRFAQPTLGIA